MYTISFMPFDCKHYNIVGSPAAAEWISVGHHKMVLSLCENPWGLLTVRILIVYQAPRILTETERLFGGEQ